MAMVICPDCGKEQDNINKFCRNCGADLSKVAVEEIRADYSQEPAVLNQAGGSSNEVTLAETSENINDKVAETSESIGNKVAENAESAVAGEDTAVDAVADVENKAEVTVPNIEKTIKKCSNCGTELADNTKFCPTCRKSTEDLSKSAAIKFCPSCGTELSPNVKFCPNCGFNLDKMTANTQGTIIKKVQKKTPIVAVILSFLFPGLGQFYNDQSTKGLYFLILAIVSWILMLILIGVLTYILIWLWSIFDAYQSAEAINRGETLEDKLF
ncbi:zinc-ribbon domain-containing protein [uncultured Methanobrevibacter sp.]|uniref:zinc-ribbon domain-containing protein n=1 Tax=uncultured Methanobrevibacter sp. TaxID=253161 RepID=UPI0025E2D247|nr:zinc-ribbon domain-containing protein [uncultured Methanobrevibacter sp.]